MKFSEQELEHRRRFVGSSDVGAILGLDDYRSRHDVWLEKLGMSKPFEGNAATEAGNDFEPVIVHRAYRHNGMIGVYTPPAVERDGWMRASLDATVHTENGVDVRGAIEAKLVGYTSQWQWGSEADGVPYRYLCQAQWQIMVAQLDFVLVAAQIGTYAPRYYRVLPDVELQAVILEQCSEFWKLVQSQTPPRVDGSDGAGRMLKALYPRDANNFRLATDKENEIAYELETAKKRLKECDVAASALENHLKESMGTTAAIKGDGWSVTYKADKNGKRVFRFTGSKE